MLKMWDEPQSEETAEAILDRVTQKIARFGLHSPAILFFEMHKPLANVAGHAAIAFSPFLVPFVGFNAVDDYSQFFSKRENIEALIQRIEQSQRQEKQS